MRSTPAKFKAVLLAFVGVLALFAVAFCLLWVASSSSMACSECNCTYSLFAVTPRCRQPPLALALAAVSALFAALAFFYSLRLYRRANEA